MAETMREGLKPCPFCGDKGKPEFHKGRGVKCGRCKSWGPDPENPRMDWNSRPGEDAALSYLASRGGDVGGLVERLRGDDGCCPFCGRDPYHYVDIGVGMERAAVTCCGLGIGLFQHGDEQLLEVVKLRDEAADALDAQAAALEKVTAERDEVTRKVRKYLGTVSSLRLTRHRLEAAEAEASALRKERDALRGLVEDMKAALCNCELVSGVCCCGDDMTSHHITSSNHAPQDMGSNFAEGWMNRARAALSRDADEIGEAEE